MRWVERTNGNGKRFLQWQQTAPGESMPEWPSETQPSCPICGEEYGPQMMTVNKTWVPTARWYIYHDPDRHNDYKGFGERPVEAQDIQAPREPGE